MKIMVFGLGYVGSVTAACLAHLGHDVTGVDIDPVKVDTINNRQSPIREERLEELIAEAVDRGRLRARVGIGDQLDDAAVSFVCVGTPSTSAGGLDTSALERVAQQLGRALPSAPGHVVAVRSTVLPGTVDDVIVPILEDSSGAKAGVDFAVAMCPELLRESTSVADFFDPPFTVVGTHDDHAEAVLQDLFGFLHAPLVRTDPRTAEAVKYACNAFHAMKVCFANEVSRFCAANGADGRSVMEVFCRDDRLNISTSYLRPGFSFGGSCLPKDVRALNQSGRAVGLDLPLLASLLPSNDQHLRYAVERILDTGARRAVLFGLSFKTGTDDLRESPFAELAEALVGKGIDLRICDPDIDPAAIRATNLAFGQERLPHLAQLLVSEPRDALEGVDAALIATTDPAIQAALHDAPADVTIIDLVGGVDEGIRSLPNYEGLAWR